MEESQPHVKGERQRFRTVRTWRDKGLNPGLTGMGAKDLRE